ncbi:MAG: hypothetical protein E2590_12865 [Chryseobacterium sp.]|nr:hypothetical protein [Chryseobacterium sp.]
MTEFNTYSKQTWLDVSIYLFGTPEHGFELATLNGYSVTDEIPAGTTINIPEGKETNRLVLLSLQSNNSIPATAIENLTPDSPEPHLEGIGYWAIGDDNIIQ